MDQFYMTSFSSLTSTVLNQAVRYFFVLGYVAIFAVFTSLLVWLDNWWYASKLFNSAGRSVKTGLIASVIISQWIWAATLLQTSPFAWENGLIRVIWCLTGATIQVLLFGTMTMVIDKNITATGAEAVCEFARTRWGAGAHVVFLIFSCMARMIVTLMLQLGISAIINAIITGVNMYFSASFLAPLGVTLYYSTLITLRHAIWLFASPGQSLGLVDVVINGGTFKSLTYVVFTGLIVIPVGFCWKTIHNVLKAELDMSQGELGDAMS